MRGFLKVVLWAAIVIAVIYLIGWAFLFQDFTATDNNMAPNIIKGDNILVYLHSPLDTGTITICADPRDETKKVVGRIAGQPGDKISLIRGSFYLNGTQLDQTAEGDYVIVDDRNTGAPQTVELSERIETMGMIRYRVLWPRQGHVVARLRNVREQTVPAGSFFLLADNRAFGEDSRTYGPVKINSCIGRPLLIYQPAESTGDADSSDRWLSIIR